MSRGVRFFAVFRGAILFIALCIMNSDSAYSEAGQATTPISQFIQSHWQRPLHAQGTAPAEFSALETTLDAQACGQCHVQQFTDWQASVHRQSMGPGLYGQLRAMGADAMEEHQACLHCHAPLQEQAQHLIQSLKAGARGAPQRSDGADVTQGLSCAGCHVRDHRRFGPPRRDGTTPESAEKLPHRGWVATEAFSDSQFCAACHQFPPDGYALNGKLLENTYVEWQQSRYARENRPCQSCHMVDRRHLWRGIHDPAMVNSGVKVEGHATHVTKSKVAAQLTLSNIGVGHYFPTYVTPLVMIEIYQTDAQGRMLAKTLMREFIGRKVSLDLTHELYDTRIAPDEVRVINYAKVGYKNARRIQFRVTVLPDAFYAEFYRATLADHGFKKGRAEITQALAAASKTPYILYESMQPLVDSKSE